MEILLIFTAAKISIFLIYDTIFLFFYYLGLPNNQYKYFLPSKLNCKHIPAFMCLKSFKLACNLKCCHNKTSMPIRNSLPVYSAIIRLCGKNDGLKVMPPTIPFHLELYPL